MGNSLQIILMGYEWDRFMLGIKERRPKKVIFLCPEQNEYFSTWQKKTEELAQKMKEKIDFFVDSEIQFISFQNYEKALTKLINIFKEHEGYSIDINISGGSKVALIATILAAQYFPCNLFYGVPKKYNVDESRMMSFGVKEWADLPVFKLKELIKPNKKEMQIIRLIKEKTSLTDLTKAFLELRQINKTDIYTMRSNKTLLLYHLNKLEKKQLVNLGKQKKEKTIQLTDTGKFVQKIEKKSKKSS